MSQPLKAPARTPRLTPTKTPSTIEALECAIALLKRIAEDNPRAVT